MKMNLNRLTSKGSRRKGRKSKPATSGFRRLRGEMLEPRVLLAADALARVRVEVRDLDNQVVTSITQGEDFTLRVYGDDLRTTGAQGIFSAYADVTFNSNLVFPAGEISYDPDFNVQRRGTIASNQIDEAGAAIFDAPGPDEQLIYSVRFTATEAGTVTFGVNPADHPDHLIGLFGRDNAVPTSQVEYVGTTLRVTRPGLVVGDLRFTEANRQAAFIVEMTQAVDYPVTVSFATQDGTATAGEDYVARSGQVTFQPGQTRKTINVEVKDDTRNEANETFSLRLSNSDNAPILDAAGVATIVDNDAASAPTLSVNDVRIVEGNSGTTNAVFTVTLSAASTSNVTVRYATANGSATAGSDFNSRSGTLTFTPGQRTKTVSVPVVGDTTQESDETFTLRLSQPTGATISDATGIGTIVNDEGVPSITINDVRIVEGNSGTTNAVFKVRLANANSQTTTVRYTTGGGTATAGTDYTARSGTINFAPGTTVVNLAIPVRGDTTNEPDETFFVTLSNPTNGAIVDEQGRGTIANDDTSRVTPTLTISDASIVEGDSGTSNMTFTLTLSEASDELVQVSYNTSAGTASGRDDYQGVGGTIGFGPGRTTKTIVVPIVGDTRVEENEVFYVNLKDPRGVTLDRTRATGTIEDNDASRTLPTLSVTNGNIVEGDSGTSGMVFTLTLSEASDELVQVSYNTSSGSASGRDDYQGVGGTIGFGPGRTTKTIVVPILGDTRVENDETFTLRLKDPRNVLLDREAASGTIQDNDGSRTPPSLPELVVKDADIVEGNSGQRVMRFDVFLSEASDELVQVSYNTSGFTASGRDDYVGTSGTIGFGPGRTEKSIYVAINGDTTVEADEALYLNLRNPRGATLANERATGTIINDDQAPKTARFAPSTVTTSDSNLFAARTTPVYTSATPADETLAVDDYYESLLDERLTSMSLVDPTGNADDGSLFEDDLWTA